MIVPCLSVIYSVYVSWILQLVDKLYEQPLIRHKLTVNNGNKYVKSLIEQSMLTLLARSCAGHKSIQDLSISQCENSDTHI